jgi:hypothetical protein
MWNLSEKAIGLLILLLLSACNFPGPEQTGSRVTVTPDTASAWETVEPSQVYTSTECAFIWANDPLPELSNEFNRVLKEVQSEAEGYAQAYGENCVTNEGEVVRFLAMETDFYVTLKVENLEDKQSLGEFIEQVMEVLAEFPTNETPGPQPGYAGITFKARDDELRLWFTQTDAETAIENGLRGEELFNALQTK